MPSFVRQLVVQAPAEEVFAFHERDDALALLSPPFPPLRVASRQGGIRVGARVDLRIVAPLTRYNSVVRAPAVEVIHAYVSAGRACHGVRPRRAAAPGSRAVHAT